MTKKSSKKTSASEEVLTEETKQEYTNQEANDKAEDVTAQLEADLQAEKDRYLRLFAEFENYKRRTSKERIELFKTASQDVMVSLLPVLDDFDRALKEIERSGDDGLLEGVLLISNKLNETLRQKGLEETDTKEGETFDAEIHEAVTQIPAPSDDLKGKILDVIEKGYTLGDKIIRFPKVVIGQ